MIVGKKQICIFFVDGERYYMMCLDNILYHAETDKDIENLIKDNANTNHEEKEVE